uniref:BTB domain-containing protein n=2 Tax=Caenorhabditis tropicalis TaxID=1561998 RepID=A0A1I7TR89_9PELO
MDGFSDKRLVDTQILALEMGIFNEVPVSDMFSWEHRSPRVSSSTRPSLDFVSEKWEESFSGPARLYDETCLLIEEGFTFNQHHMFLIMAVFKRTFNSKEFLSFGALFGMPPSKEIFHCKIRIQSPIAGIDSSVERYLKHGQNTIMIPTLFDCSELTEKLVSFNIKVQLETVSNEFHPKHVVMPGITNLTVKSKSGSFKVDKNVLIEKVDFFKTYLRNIHFGGHIKKEIRLTETEFKEFSHIVDAVYHGSKTCDVDSFVLFGTASDAFLCTELYSVWEKSALKCKTPEVRAMVIKQQKNE